MKSIFISHLKNLNGTLYLSISSVSGQRPFAQHSALQNPKDGGKCIFYEPRHEKPNILNMQKQ